MGSSGIHFGHSLVVDRCVAGPTVPPFERALPCCDRGEQAAVQHRPGPEGEHPGFLQSATSWRNWRRQRQYGGGECCALLKAALLELLAAWAAEQCQPW
jgi:hypothetical protein